MGRTDFDRRFGQRLKDLRKVYGFRQEDAARKLCVTPGTMAHYEQGFTEPDLELLADAVCTRFSYGGKDGYLEVMAENLPTKVEGWLTAEQVMKMAYWET